jgi:hypothetical protein
MARHVRTSVGLALGSLLVLACARDDARLKNLTVGISKDSALSVLGVTSGERPATYLVKGKTIEAMMIRREGIEGPLDSLTQAQYTPIVVVDGKLAGWGWTFWDSVSNEIGLAK